MRILLVNPAIYDFTAYNFWMRPYGLLTVGGFLQSKAEIVLFDFLDSGFDIEKDKDQWGRGKFRQERINKPKMFGKVARYYNRFGRGRSEFQDFLRHSSPFDFVMIQTVMTYWYLGVSEIVEDVKAYCPKAKIIAGGVYASICREHCLSLGVDFAVQGSDLEPLWNYIGCDGDENLLPFWQGYNKPFIGAIKLADGCPFRCTYCCAWKLYPKFEPRNLNRSIAELEFMNSIGIKDIAFYDDSLLYKSEDILEPFLNEVIARNIKVNFHTPNAINARFVNSRLASLMVEAGVKTFYIGFESGSQLWQQTTGGKVSNIEFANAVETLSKAGADKKNITAYMILGHPKSDIQEIEASLQFVHSCGVRIMLADFSPIPDTRDGDACGGFVDMSEPLNHNKTAFVIGILGNERVNKIKQTAKRLNLMNN